MRGLENVQSRAVVILAIVLKKCMRPDTVVRLFEEGRSVCHEAVPRVDWIPAWFERLQVKLFWTSHWLGSWVVMFIVYF